MPGDIAFRWPGGSHRSAGLPGQVVAVMSSPSAVAGEVSTGPFPPTDGAAGTVIAWRYRLLQQLGEGGFGVVFLAEQRDPVHRTVAVKVIKPGMDSAQIVGRF